MAVTGHLAARIGLTVEEARARLHAIAADAPPETATPTWDEVEAYLVHHRARLRADKTLDPGRRDRIVAHYDDAVALRRAPSPTMWRAWKAFADSHRRLDVRDHVAALRPAPALPTPQTPISDEQIVAIARTFIAHQVDAVVIGGLAGLLHGVRIARTYDADLCASREPDNLRRLSEALNDMNAKIRNTETGQPVEGVPVTMNLFGPGTQTVIFSTDHGPVDIAFRPEGTDGYDDLNENATTIVFQDEPIRVASTPDVIRSKAAANRQKDRDTLPAYEKHERDNPTPSH